MKLPGRTKPKAKTAHQASSNVRKPHNRYMRMATLVAAVALTGWLGLELLFPSKAAAPTTQAGLAGLIQNVPGAAIFRYNTTDSQGVPMYGAKIIPSPGGGYLAVYTYANNTRLATSTDLKNWTFRTVLTTGASAPSILSTSAGGFVFADEYNPASKGAIVRVFHFPNLSALYAARYDRIYSAAHTLSSCNEGTPNIISVDLSPDISRSTIKLGFHYHTQCGTSPDRTASATLTNFSAWQTAKAPGLDVAVGLAAAANGLPMGGNISGLDMTTYGNVLYGIVGGQSVSGNNDSWRPYLFSFASNQAQLLNIRTHKGSQVFGGPRMTVTRGPDGTTGVIVSMLVGGTVAGETGELIYYARATDPVVAPAPAKPAAPKPSPSPKPATSGSKTSAATPPPAVTPPAETPSSNTDSGSTDKVMSLDEIPVGSGDEEDATTGDEGDGSALAAAKDKKFRNISLIVSAVIVAAGIGLIMFLRRRTLQTETDYDGYNYNADDEFGFTNETEPLPPQLSSDPANDYLQQSTYQTNDYDQTGYATNDYYSAPPVAPVDTYGPQSYDNASQYDSAATDTYDPYAPASTPVPTAPANPYPYEQPQAPVAANTPTTYAVPQLDSTNAYAPAVPQAPQTAPAPQAPQTQQPMPQIAPAPLAPPPIAIASPETLSQQPRREIDDYFN